MTKPASSHGEAFGAELAMITLAHRAGNRTDRLALDLSAAKLKQAREGRQR